MPRKGTRKTVAKAADIRTVAALAKVSIATVSRTINGSPAVSDRLSKRVWQAIEQLNYFPNTHARSLVSGRSRLFGIIVENITNPFFPELIQSFEEVAVANGYEILVSSSNSDPAILTTCVRRMLERKVEGVAVLTFGEEEPVLDQLAHHNVPLVLAEFKLDDPKSSTILLDYSTGFKAAVQHLAGLGHKRIGFLAGPHTLHSAITRENDFPHGHAGGGTVGGSGDHDCLRSHAARRRGGVREAAGAGQAAYGGDLLERHDRDRRAARRVYEGAARAAGSVGHRAR